MTHDALLSFFGWMSVLNIAFLTISALLLMGIKDWVSGLHARLFNVEEPFVLESIYRWLGTYKILTLIFSVMPYLALRLF